MSPLAKSLKPPIVIKKGARGYGFTLKAIRVYLGNSNTYALQHIVVVSKISRLYTLLVFIAI
jgi:microtubule-associated serine/threonine kinase